MWDHSLETKLKPQVNIVLIKWFWESHLTSLRLNVLIYSIGKVLNIIISFSETNLERSYRMPVQSLVVS